MLVMSRDIGAHVQEPTRKLLSDHMSCRHDGRLLHELAQFVGVVTKLRGVLFAGLGHEDHVSLQMASGFVVFAVGNLPREIRDEQGGVANPPNRVVQPLRGRKGLMSTFVGQDPKTRAKASLYKGICRPQNGAQGGRRDIFRSQVRVEEVEREGEGSNVAGHIAQAPDGGAFEAMSGDRVPDLLDGEVWDLELVAIGVKQFPINLLDGESGIERGQRCARRRVTWGVIGRGRSGVGYR